MRITTDYENMPEAEAQAISDLKDWLGDRFDMLEAGFKANPYTLEQFRLILSFGGVQGYPVTVWHKRIYG